MTGKTTGHTPGGTVGNTMDDDNSKKAPTIKEPLAIKVTGIVQGVGFRPFIWRLATEMGLMGEVLNNSAGVLIHLKATRPEAETLISRIKSEHPPLAKIGGTELTASKTQQEYSSFSITQSDKGEMQTQIAPDAATCKACVKEIITKSERRYRYPFTNCTHCGPRLTIIREAPYDRATTSMAPFIMCPDCGAEYENPMDRRFHAQPIACPACGPTLELVWLGETQEKPELDPDPLTATIELLKAGFIGAIKGLGGFHLACLSDQDTIVTSLRQRKKRSNKAFALMVKDVKTAKAYVHINEEEEKVLTSERAPILLLDRKQNDLPEAIAPGLNQLGMLLPNTPLHHLILAEFSAPLIMTSGNLSNRPQIIDNQDACTSLKGIADFALLHNRPITNRVDDSVVRLTRGQPTLLRRARGYAPAPLPLPNGFEAASDLLAFGGELKSTVCFLKNGQAILSQHQGDLEDLETFTAYQNTIALYTDLFEMRPTARVIDKHPDYLSSKYAAELSEKDQLPLISVQHHHAHMAAAMGENNVALDEPPCLGLILDGVGFGEDDSIWGGELFYGSYQTCERIGAFPAVPMPGGGAAVKQPWRNLVAHLETALGYEDCAKTYQTLPLMTYLASKSTPTLLAMMRKNLNSPKGSSCGRLFDAVAASLDISPDEVTYEGEAAMRMEALVDLKTMQSLAKADLYKAEMREEGTLLRLNFAPLWRALLDDIAKGETKSLIATKFHQSCAMILKDWVEAALEAKIAREKGEKPSKIALSGGCFQNKTLLEALVPELEAIGLTPLTQHQTPANDGGLSYGQALIAAAQLLRK